MKIIDPWNNVTITKINEEHNSVHSFDGNVHLIYVLKGSIMVGNDRETLELHAPGFFILPKSESYAIMVTSALAFDISLHYAFNKEPANTDYSYEFAGNSKKGGNKFDDDLILLLDRLLAIFYLEKRTTSDVAVFEVYFSILNLLENKYHREVPIKKGDRSVAGRIEEIKLFIDNNYEKEIKLKDIARKFFVSEQYLSRSFSETIGMPLSEYLTELRLNKVKQELTESNKSITSIVYDAGFTNVNSFNRIFKNRYGISPTSFRKDNRNKDFSSPVEEEPLFDDQLLPLLNSHERESKKDSIKLDYRDSVPLKMADGIINVGPATNLLNTRFTAQLDICNDISLLRYIRISDILNEEMASTKKGQLIFSGLDEVISIVLKSGYQPFIVLNPPQKPEGDDGTQLFYPMDAWLDSILQFCKHYLSKYGREVVKAWKMELVQPHFRYFKSSSAGFSLFKVEEQILDLSEFNDFMDYCHQIKNAIERYRPGFSVGIGGIELKHVSDANKEPYYKLTRLADFDFIGVTALPYLERTSTSKGKSAIVKQSKEGYLSKLTNRLHVLMKENIQQIPIYLTEFNITSFDSDLINDTAFKGAYIFKNHLDLSIYYSGIGYWNFSDLSNHFLDGAGKEFFGGPGLMTVNGIPKIGIYAYAFLDRIGTELIFESSTLLVAKNPVSESIAIVAYGYTPVDPSYFSMFDTYDIKNGAHIFSNYVATSTVIHLNNLPISAGEYQLTLKKIGYFEGNAMNEALKVTSSDYLAEEVLNYLKKKSEPIMYTRTLTVEDGSIELPVKIEPQQLILFELWRIY